MAVGKIQRSRYRFTVIHFGLARLAVRSEGADSSSTLVAKQLEAVPATITA